MQRVRKFLLWFPKESRSGGVKVQKDHQSTRPNKERGREESWGFTFHRAAAAAEQTELSSSVFSRQLYLMSALPSNHNSPPSLFSLLCLPFSHALCFLTYANSQQKDLCSTSHQPPAVLFFICAALLLFVQMGMWLNIFMLYIHYTYSINDSMFCCRPGILTNLVRKWVSTPYLCPRLYLGHILFFPLWCLMFGGKHVKGLVENQLIRCFSWSPPPLSTHSDLCHIWLNVAVCSSQSGFRSEGQEDRK